MYREAIKYFDMALEINPRSDSAWSWKGKALNHLRRYAEAIVCFDKALAIRPVATEPRNGKAEALISLGRREEAIRCYDEGLEMIGPRFPRSPYVCGVWAKKGVVLNDLGRYAEAVVCFDKALAIDPQLDYARKGRMLAVRKLEKRDSRLSRLLTWRR
jgi:tetratricopeptide (TPR) repeat protein